MIDIRLEPDGEEQSVTVAEARDLADANPLIQTRDTLGNWVPLERVFPAYS